MNLEKAIEILTNLANTAWDKGNEQDADAYQLGIEALRAILSWRISYDDDILMTLPGETED